MVSDSAANGGLRSPPVNLMRCVSCVMRVDRSAYRYEWLVEFLGRVEVVRKSIMGWQVYDILS